ncbi:MAG: hypothetical protein JWQ97_2425 [Phenylobacterium sp.]|nr:hypothetical protein [Phenylobacterium sp.]
MRIALCLSGQPRTWRATRSSLAAFFTGHEVDVFLHTWGEGDPAELAALVEAYTPRAHRIEARPLFAAEKRLLAERFPTRPPLTIFDMFHSVAQSLALAAEPQNGIYDLVVRARFDAIFDGAWPGEAPGAGELVLPDLYPDASGVNDQFAIGRMAEMRAYGGIGAWLPTVLPSLRGAWFRPEAAVRVYLEDVCGLRLKLEPIAMRLLREGQVGRPFAALADDPLFHAEKHEAWEAFAAAQFPEVAAQADFDHAARTPLALDRALSGWLEGRPPKDTFQLLKAPWPKRIKAVDAFIADQAGELPELDEDSYRGVRLICAMLLQRMDRREPMTLEGFLVHVLSANVADMRRAAEWGDAHGDKLAALPQATKGLGPLARALAYAPPLAQTGVGAWRMN